MTVNNDTFYLTFKDVHPSWSLIACALPMAFLVTLGMIFNCSVIFVTIRTKSLHGTVNYILALYSFMELLHQPGNYLFIYTAFSVQNFIEYRLAAKIMLIPMFGFGGSYPTIFFTGIDRLIVNIVGEMYSKPKIRLYLTTVTIACTAFSMNSSNSLYQSMSVYGDQMVIGCYIDFRKGPSSKLLIDFLLILTTIIIYVIVGFIIRNKLKGLPSADQVNLRVFRSLFCIITVNVGGYFINLIFIFLISPLISSPITAWFGHYITGILINIGVTANGPVLYFMSTDYRKAFQTEFPFVFKQSSTQNQVIPLQNVVVPKRTTMRS